MEPTELPAHASPALSPQAEIDGYPQLTARDLTAGKAKEPPTLVSPLGTPPHTPGPGESWQFPVRQAQGVSVNTDSSSDDLVPPALLPRLPKVECYARARIPTTTGADMWLHVFRNDVDNKDHLAIVFGHNPDIRSQSLFEDKPGETEQDRMNRGAYEGKLYPGRTSSRAEHVKEEDRTSFSSSNNLLRDLHEKRFGEPKSHAPQRSTVPTQTAISSNNFSNGEEDDFPGFEEGLSHSSTHRESSTTYSSEAQAQVPIVAAQRLSEMSNQQKWEDFPGYEDGSRNTWASDSASNSEASVPTTPSNGTVAHHYKRHHSYKDPPLVRIHSECYTGETVWSARCDCGEQLDEAARLMSAPRDPHSPTTSSGGVIIYLRQEGRGIGLPEKLKAYNLQDLGYDTFEANVMLRHPADARSYGLATAMLVDLGLGGEQGIRLLTNNPDKIRAVEGPSREVRVRERVAMVPLAWSSHGKKGVHGKEVEGYLSTKVSRSC